MLYKKRSFFLVLAVTAILTALICHHTIDSEDWQVWSPRIPPAFDGLRITLLTDLHGRELGKDSEKLLRAVEASKPDLIAISGDLADEASDTAMLDPLLKGLAAVAPTYYVPGNHEWKRPDQIAVFQQIADCGVTVLRNGYIPLIREDQSILLAGADDPNGYRDMETPANFLSRIRTEQNGDPYVVMLYHRNNSMDLWSGLDADLVLAGHGHGGVIRLPFVGGLLGVDRRFFPKDAEGLYVQGRTTLAVSRGLGGVRLWNPSHLPTIVLKSGTQP